MIVAVSTSQMIFKGRFATVSYTQKKRKEALGCRKLQEKGKLSNEGVPRKDARPDGFH
jgi:hypothetical protein